MSNWIHRLISIYYIYNSLLLLFLFVFIFSCPVDSSNPIAQQTSSLERERESSRLVKNCEAAQLSQLGRWSILMVHQSYDDCNYGLIQSSLSIFRLFARVLLSFLFSFFWLQGGRIGLCMMIELDFVSVLFSIHTHTPTHTHIYMYKQYILYGLTYYTVGIWVRIETPRRSKLESLCLVV